MVLFASAAGAAELAPLMTRSILLVAAIDAATDNIGAGWCGRGMLSILRNVGLGYGLAGGNGQDWDMILSKARWKAVRYSSPDRAPLGGVLTLSPAIGR
jgi:hypothetical protein